MIGLMIQIFQELFAFQKYLYSLWWNLIVTEMESLASG